MRQCLVGLLLLVAGCAETPPVATTGASYASLQERSGSLSVVVTEERAVEGGSSVVTREAYALPSGGTGRAALLSEEQDRPPVARAPLQPLPTLRSITRGLAVPTSRLAATPGLAMNSVKGNDRTDLGAQLQALRDGADSERALAGGMLEFTKRVQRNKITIVFDPRSNQMVSVVLEDASGRRLERDLLPQDAGVVERMRISGGTGATRSIEVRLAGGAP